MGLRKHLRASIFAANSTSLTPPSDLAKLDRRFFLKLKNGAFT